MNRPQDNAGKVDCPCDTSTSQNKWFESETFKVPSKMMHLFYNKRAKYLILRFYYDYFNFGMSYVFGFFFQVEAWQPS